MTTKPVQARTAEPGEPGMLQDLIDDLLGIITGRAFDPPPNPATLQSKQPIRVAGPCCGREP